MEVKSFTSCVCLRLLRVIIITVLLRSMSGLFFDNTDAIINIS